jgi:hypothetical protein
MKIKSVTLTYADKPRPVIIPSAVVPPPYAGEIREKKVRRIDAYFA